MEQLMLGQLKRGRERKAPRTKPDIELAAVLPIARVVLDVAHAHLDRVFEYVVPAALDQAAVPGVRVRVRFSGRLVDGFILERTAAARHGGKLIPLQRVNGVAVLTPEIALLARGVADRYAGTMSDVLRLAIPPRHATAERSWQSSNGQPTGQPSASSAGGQLASSQPTELIAAYTGGAALARRIETPASAVRAALIVSSTDDPTTVVAELVGHALAGGGVLVVVPDARDVDRFAAPLVARYASVVQMLQADMGTSARYRAFLNILSGQAKVVIGTRAAAFAPVNNLALGISWDDGDESHSEPRSPGWHTREVLALRSAQTGAAFIAAGHSRSVEVARMVSSGWARSVEQPRVQTRQQRHIKTVDDDLRSSYADVAGARLPHVAWEAANRAVKTGPVLVQVARSGYVPAVACASCRTAASCSECHGPLSLSSGHAIAACRWCGRFAGDWHCPECGNDRLRARSIGVARTAEELGRAFPGVPIVVSGRGAGVVDVVADSPAIVVATVGAEPIAENGYCAALLLDGDALLAQADSRSEEEAVRRWFNAVALVRSANQHKGTSDGRIVITANPAHAAVQALIRNDPAGWAARELEQRCQSNLPPAVRVAAISGPAAAVERFVAECRVTITWRVLGPVPVTVTAPTAPTATRHADEVRTLLTSSLAEGEMLITHIRAALVAASARPGGSGVRVRIDPIVLL